MSIAKVLGLQNGRELGEQAAQLADMAQDKDKIYGVFWNKGSSPTLIRTDDAVGFTAQAGVDTTLAFNQFDATPIFAFTEVTDSYGNVFVRIPKMYIKKVDGAGYKTRQISRTMFTGAYLPKCFWDFTNNRELDYIDVGKYKANISDDGTKLESKSGKYPLVNKNIVEFRTLAKANGAGYQQYDIHVHDLLTTLFLIEFATLNSQSICAGFTSGQYTDTHLATKTEVGANRIVVANAHGALYRVGQTISVGTTQGGNQRFYGRQIVSITADTPDAGNTAVVFDGAPVSISIGDRLYNTGAKSGFGSGISASVGSLVSNSDGLRPFVWHGIESLYGDLWQFVDGVNINEGQAWACKDADDYASNIFALPYEQLGYVNGAIEGYPIALGFDANLPSVEFPITVGGSASTYYSDYYYRTTGQRIARVGGSWNDGSSAGLSHWNLDYSSSSASVDVGGRLLRKPL